MSTTLHNLGRVAGELAEAYAYVLSPARIAGEIRRYQEAINGGDTSVATGALLDDWRAIRAAQVRLVTNASDADEVGR